jgi:hypothetical protein
VMVGPAENLEESWWWWLLLMIRNKITQTEWRRIFWAAARVTEKTELICCGVIRFLFMGWAIKPK